MNFRSKFSFLYGLWGIIPSFIAGAFVAGMFIGISTLFTADSGKTFGFIDPVGYSLGGLSFIISMIMIIRYGYGKGIQKEQDAQVRFPTKFFIWSTVGMVVFILIWLVNA
ncbi:MAG: hypothetical protein WCT27_01610 [Patescibacteria group bacterium]|jgi:hypothetical protein